MKKFIAVFSTIFVVLAALFTMTEVQINRTPSLPYKAFFVVKGLPYSKGDLVSIRGHETEYFSGYTFTKRVSAIAGDAVPEMPSYKAFTKSGKPLNKLSITTVPTGYMFVSADSKDSFDSRYEEFGLVKDEHIIGRSFPIW